MSDGFVLQAQTTQPEWQSLKDYFERRESLADDPVESAGKSAFERKMDSWLSTTEALAQKFGGMNDLMDRWGYGGRLLEAAPL